MQDSGVLLWEERGPLQGHTESLCNDVTKHMGWGGGVPALNSNITCTFKIPTQPESWLGQPQTPRRTYCMGLFQGSNWEGRNRYITLGFLQEGWGENVINRQEPPHELRFRQTHFSQPWPFIWHMCVCSGSNFNVISLPFVSHPSSKALMRLSHLSLTGLWGRLGQLMTTSPGPPSKQRSEQEPPCSKLHTIQYIMLALKRSAPFLCNYWDDEYSDC